LDHDITAFLKLLTGLKEYLTGRKVVITDLGIYYDGKVRFHKKNGSHVTIDLSQHMLKEELQKRIGTKVTVKESPINYIIIFEDGTSIKVRKVTLKKKYTNP
jgi:hypothetical protein